MRDNKLRAFYGCKRKLILVVHLIVLVSGGFGETAWAGKDRAAKNKAQQFLDHLRMVDHPVNRHPANAPTLSLKDAYLAALKLSETVNIQADLLVQAEELKNQAFSSMYPTVVANGKFLQQEPPSGIGAAFSPAAQQTGFITITQPLFRGLQDFAALRQRKGAVGAQYFTLVNAAKQLFYDLSTAYYNVLSYQQDEANYLIEINDNVKRLNDLEEFYKIGRSQLTDVLTFQSSIASLQNQLENTRGLIAVAREVLVYLTGWNHDFVLKDEEPVSLKPGELQEWLNRMESRPDIQAALDNLSAFREGEPIAWGYHWPTLSATGDYYFFRPGSAYAGINWDAYLSLSIPIYQGGAVNSQIRQAQSVTHQYSLQLSQTRRLADQEIRTFYAQLDADQKQVAKLTELVSISEENYHTEIKYYKNGLVTNLDVIQSMTTFEDAKRQLDHQRFAVQMDYVKLQAATGGRAEIRVDANQQIGHAIERNAEQKTDLTITPKG